MKEIWVIQCGFILWLCVNNRLIMYNNNGLPPELLKNTDYCGLVEVLVLIPIRGNFSFYDIELALYRARVPMSAMTALCTISRCS